MRITFSVIVFILLSSLIISCFSGSGKKNSEKNIEAIKQRNYLQYFKKNGVDMNNSIVVFLPATLCEACNMLPSDSLKKLENAYIFYAEGTSCQSLISSQKCISYSIVEATSLGMLKMYPEIFTIKSSKIVSISNWVK